MDFVLGLLRTQGDEDSVFIVLDRFSKIAYFITCSKNNDATQVAELYFKEVIRLPDIVRSIISDTDTNFLCHFWITLWKKLETKLKFSTIYHLLTDGQTKVTDRTLRVLLRVLIKTHAKAWNLLFPYVEFAYNKALHKSTGISPFKIVYDIEPLTLRDLTPRVPEGKPSMETKRRIKEI